MSHTHTGTAFEEVQGRAFFHIMALSTSYYSVTPQVLALDAAFSPVSLTSKCNGQEACWQDVLLGCRWLASEASSQGGLGRRQRGKNQKGTRLHKSQRWLGSANGRRPLSREAASTDGKLHINLWFMGPAWPGFSSAQGAVGIRKCQIPLCI